MKLDSQMDNAETKFPTRIEKEIILTLPKAEFNGAIHLIDDATKLDGLVRSLQNQRVLGFDTETRPVFKKGEHRPVALLQLATSEAVYLVRLNHLPLPECVKAVLSDPKVVKVGVATHDDIKSLQALSPFEAHSFLDLSKVAKRLQIETTGLRSLAAIFLGLRVSKRSQMSNWESPQLNAQQITYAATDAWICREIYFYLHQHHVLSNLS